MNRFLRLSVAAGFCIAASGLACSDNHSASESVSAAQSALAPANRVLGFELPTTDWTPSSLRLQSGTQHIEGSASAKVAVTINGGTLTSSPLSTLGPVAPSATLQLWLPAYLKNLPWQGQAALRLNSPSAGVFSQYSGPAQFQNQPTGTFQKAQFALPPSVVTALSTKSYSDLVVTLELDFIPNPHSDPNNAFSDPFYLDALSFGGSSAGAGGSGGTAGAEASAGRAGNGGSAGRAGNGGTSGSGAVSGGAGAGGSGGGSSAAGSGATVGGAGAVGSGGSGNVAGSAGMSGGTGGASGAGFGPCAFGAPVAGGPATNATFMIKLPHGLRRENVGLAATGGSLTLDDHVTAESYLQGLFAISSVAASSRTMLGVGAQVGEAYSEPLGIDLRNDAHVLGILKTAADLQRQAGAVVEGAVSENTSLQPLDPISWVVPFPVLNSGSCSIEPDNTQLIEPGSYGDINVKSRSRLKLRSGTYYFSSLSFEPQAELAIDNAAGPVFIYVRTDLAFSGSVVETDTSRMNFLFGVAGTNGINIQSAFRGILVAPFAAVSLPTQQTVGHTGSFFAKSLILHQATVIHQQPFSPALFCDAAAACSSFCPCDAGGTCVENAQCAVGLVCGGHVGHAPTPSVCVAPSCLDNPHTLGCGFAGAACGPSCTRNWICTSSSNCAAGYVCGANNGYRYGLSGANVCELPSCKTAPTVAGCGPISSECGLCSCTPDCAGKHCGDADVDDGCGHTCPALCSDGQTNCQSDDECISGDVCISSGGVRSCLPAICRDPVQSLQHCGLAGALCGPCQVPAAACSDLECGTDPTYGVACGDSTRADAICIGNHWVQAPNVQLRTLNLPFRRNALDPPVLVAYPPLSSTTPTSGFGFGATPGSFEVTDRGAARYSIPIAVPPGRAGVAPSLGLHYLSTKANGYLGVGFSLSGLSVITTCGKTLAVDGIDRAVQGQRDDPYCLDGQRLIRVGPGEYRTELDTFVKVVEGSGLPPKRGGTFPVAGFTAYSKNGRIRRFAPLTWTFANDNNEPVIRSWAVAREEDRSNNTINIVYQQFPAADCPNGNCDIVEAVPLTINYGANPRGGLDHDRHVDFHYTDDRADHLLGYASGGLEIHRSRLLDTVKTYVGDKLVRQYSLHYETSPNTSAQRLQSLQECATGYFSATTSCHSPTVFTYKDPPHPKPVRGAAFAPASGLGLGTVYSWSSDFPFLSALDLDGDGYLDLTSVNSAYTKKLGLVGPIYGASAQTNRNSARPLYEFPNQGRVLATSGADPGALDYFSFHSKFDEVQAGIDKDHPYGDGSISLPGPTPLGVLKSAAKPRLVDVDGDEIQDLLLCTSEDTASDAEASSQMRSFFFKGLAAGGFEPAAQALSAVPVQGANCDGIDRLDLDGDGRSELIVDTAFLSGFAALGDSHWQVDDRLHAVSAHEAVLADVNGDGLKDLVKFNPSMSGSTVVLLALNRGGYFGEYVTQPGEPDTVAVSGIQVADVNGDHCDDLLYANPTGGNILAKYGSPGSKISVASVYASIPVEPEPAGSNIPHGFILADFNNDGAPDIAVPHSDATHTMLSIAAQQDLLSSVTDGEARRTEVTYDAAAYDSQWANRCDWPARCDRSVGPVVSQAVLSSGSLVGSFKAHNFRIERSQQFSYKRSRHGALGRGELGFESRKITTLDGTGALISRTQLNFDNSTFEPDSKTFPFAGFVMVRVDTSEADQSELEAIPAASSKRVEQAWELLTSSSGRLMIGLQSRTTTISELPSSEEGQQDRTLFTTVEQFTTDGFGNVGAVYETQLAAGAEWLTRRTTVTHYRTDLLSRWLIALPLDRTVTDTVYPGFSGAPQRSTRSLPTTTYDFNDRGILTFIGEGTPSTPRSTSFTPDDFGNIREIRISDPGAAAQERTLAIVFDELQQFPSTITNSLNQVTHVTYDPSLGTLLTSSDPNEQVTQNGYDEFARLLMVATPSGVVERSYLSAAINPLDPSLRAVSVVRVSDSTGGQRVDYLDALGRSVRSTSIGLQGKQVSTERDYGPSGLLRSETRPHLDGDASQGSVTYSYDKRRRLISTALNGVVTKYGYASAVNCQAATCPEGLAEMTLRSSTSPRDHSIKLTLRNQRGQPTRVIEGGGTSKYSYGPFEKLHDTTDPEGNVTLLEYDDLLRLHHLADPDKGAETYAYNAFDELETVTEDSSGHYRNYLRDSLGRTTQITDSIDGVTRFCFDSACDQPGQRNEVGNLVESVSPTGIHTRSEFESAAVDSPAAAAAGLFATVNRGFLKATHRTVLASVTGESADEEFVTNYSYNDQNLLSRIDYPASAGEPFGVSYGYDGAGNLNELRDANASVTDPHATFWRLTEVYQGLLPSSEIWGDNTTTTQSYDPLLGFLDTLAVKTNATNPSDAPALQDLTFQHYADGLLKSVGAPGIPPTATVYDYDAVGRLRHTFPRFFLSKEAQYSPSGNITFQTDLGNYTYGDPTAPHRATQVDGTNYQYHANGDIWTRTGKDVVGATQAFEHTGFHLPRRVLLGEASGASQEVAFDYDADQHRTFKRSPLGARLYMGSGYERFTPSDTGPHAFPGETREHIYKVYAPGNLFIQVVRAEQTGTITDQAVLYVHADQLGSPAVIRDQAGGDHGRPQWTTGGAPVGTASWGSEDPLARTVRTTFTGHEFDEELGLTNMQGRIYDQKIGRFMEADPYVQAPFSTQGLNRYSYAFNSPLNYTDPSGYVQQFGGLVVNNGGWDGGDGWAGADNSWIGGDLPPSPNDILVCGSNIPVGCGGFGQPSTSSFLSGFFFGPGGNTWANSDPPPSANGDFSPGRPQSQAGADIARGAFWKTLGAGEGAVPFGTLGSQLAPPSNGRDLVNLGLGQLLGAAAVFGEAGGIAGGGVAMALTGVGVPAGVAAEVAAAVVAVGGAVNALEGVYNIARGTIQGGGGAAPGTPPPNMSPSGSGRTGAFNEAKRQNNIPTSQQPERVQPNLDRRGDPQPGKQYVFRDINGNEVIIRDDAGGHDFGPGDPQSRGPHFNDPSGNHYDY